MQGLLRTEIAKVPHYESYEIRSTIKWPVQLVHLVKEKKNVIKHSTTQRNGTDSFTALNRELLPSRNTHTNSEQCCELQLPLFLRIHCLLLHKIFHKSYTLSTKSVHFVAGVWAELGAISTSLNYNSRSDMSGFLESTQNGTMITFRGVAHKRDLVNVNDCINFMTVN